eukprot:Rmarinus@m.12097
MSRRVPANCMGTSPSFLEHKQFRFLIMDSPSDSSLPLYLKEMEENNVRDLVRVCECTYDDTAIKEQGITVHHWPFPDGDGPPKEILDNWLSLCSTRFGKKNSAKESIAVHCVAGLGRAPVLVAVALIEGGMTPEDAVSFIREKRKGAINAKQLKFVQAYKPRKSGSCIVM